MIETVNKLDKVVEMDESYIGGKPHKRNMRIADNTAAYANVYTKVKRGRGADKIKVVGIVQRGKDGRVYTKMMEELSARNLLAMLKKYVDLDKGKSVIATDEFKSYHQFNKILPHFTVNHSKGEYVRNNVHVNTIEGYWSIIKNGIRGQYHVLSKKYLPFYLAEFAYKYNRRDQKDTFEETIKRAVCLDKCTIYYKPKRPVNLLTYPRGKQSGSCALGSVSDFSEEGLDIYTHLMIEEIKSLSKSGLAYLEAEGRKSKKRVTKCLKVKNYLTSSG
jgi:transposase-like protein